MSRSFACAQPAHRPFVPSPKVPRDRLCVLSVEADQCPQILLRVLGLVARQGSVPLSITAARKRGGQEFEVAIDTLSHHEAAVLLARVETMAAVRRAELISP